MNLKRNLKALFFLVLISCGQAATREEAKGSDKNKHDNWTTFKDDKYSIQYPPDWTFNDEGRMGSTFIIFSPFESKEDKFQENVNLLVQDLQGIGMELDLDQYTTLSEGQIKTMLENSKMIESKRLQKGSRAYHKVIYSAVQNNQPLHFEQYYWVENKKAFILTLTCESDKFEKYRETGEDILNSFAFVK